jgi:hypothetical protein
MNNDDQHLKLLSIFHYILGGILLLVGCLFILQVWMVVAMATGEWEFRPNETRVPTQFAWVMAIFLALFLLFAWTLAVLVFLTGRKIAQRKNHLFCMVVAAMECLVNPIGTLLGVFTIIILMRPSVKEKFGIATEPPRVTPADS